MGSFNRLAADSVATAVCKMPFVKNAAENSGTSAVAGIEILRLGAWAQETLQDPLAPPQVLRPPRGASPV